MDHESGAVPSDRSAAVRAAEEARQRSSGRAPFHGRSEWTPRDLRSQGAEPPPARRLDGPHAGRATGDRDRVLFRVDVRRSGATVESAARNRQDASPVRAGETPAGARQETVKES